MTTHFRTTAHIAVLTLDNPPVNGLGLDTRAALAAGIDAALADPEIAAIVIRGAGKVFCGGADIREFDSPKMLAEPNLHQLIAQIEASPKPVVVALHGVCMGGGTELALGAHARVAQRGTQIGLPEVNIGLVPGAGGTQRLPRAIGLETALAMIVSGLPRKAEQLAALPGQRLLTAVTDGDPLEAAIAQAQALAASGERPRLRDVAVDTAGIDADAVLAQAMAATHPGFPSQARCVDCVAAAVREPIDQGLAFEGQSFVALLATPESRALRHAFFAERAAARIPDVPEHTPTRPLHKVGVIGAGTMGGGIAMSLINAGLPVTLLEASQEALDRGLATIRKNYEGSVRKGSLSAEALAQRLALLTPTLEYTDLADCDLVIEAVFEDFEVKAAVFRRLDAVSKPGAILASNTSTLDIDRIAAVTSRPQDVLGLHFFSPANIMKLLEVVRGSATAKDVLATAMALAKRIGKTAVVAGNCDGFIGNRMIEQYSRQAGFLLEEGALPAQIDAAMERFGFAMGPFRMSDLAGNDIGWAIRKRRAIERPDLVYPAIFDKLCETGRFGQKTGAGWYDYLPGDRKAHPSALVDELVIAHSRSLGIARRDISDREIVERLVYALVNEGAQLLAEGHASRASDIDVVYLTGYGFPRWRGGPMQYAEEVGLAQVVASMRAFADADGAARQAGAWAPAPLLVRLAETGRGWREAGRSEGV